MASERPANAEIDDAGGAPIPLPAMRSLRSRLRGTSIVAATLALSCGGFQQGYYSACDEPAGLALGCPFDNEEAFTTWDACLKLAGCGVLLTSTETNDPDPFAQCVEQLEIAERDMGNVVLACIQENSCPDLVATVDDNDDPNSQRDDIEGIIGWCGRADPR